MRAAILNEYNQPLDLDVVLQTAIDGAVEVLTAPIRRGKTHGTFHTKELVAAILASEAAIVLDADAITSFADEPNSLFSLLREFRRCGTPLQCLSSI